MKKAFIAVVSIIFAAGMIAGYASLAEAAGTPHGGYSNDTDECRKCHITHNGQGPGLIVQPSTNSLCYLCHDAGGQSQYDVASQFGSIVPYAASHHPVPEGTQKCTDCHNPHDGGKDANGNEVHWPRLLQSRADPAVHGGNQFCFSCHQNAQGTTKSVNPSTYPVDGKGHNNTSFTINGGTPFNPSSGTNISCGGCHERHGSDQVKLLRDDPNNDTANITGNNKSQCYECHTAASPDNRYQGQGVFDTSKHGQATSLNTNTEFPGVIGQAGQCANCHDPHGTANGTSKVGMKSLRGVYNDGKTSYSAADFDLCFKCHNGSSLNPKYDIQSQYNDSAGGHRIKTSGGSLAVGSVLPCEDCHTLHGSTNNNKYSLNDNLGSNLGDGRNECLACHQTGKTVEGIAMSAPTSTVPEHADNTSKCLNCHGGPHKVTEVISKGGEDCVICHSPLVLATQSSSSGYHHLLSDSSATYSTTQNGARNCLSCHVDHSKFNNRMAYNLKADFSQSFAVNDTTPGQNTDFNASDPQYGGICLSCHKDGQSKGYLQPDSSTATPPISIAGYTGSAHNYTASSNFKDATVFEANCSKCHNDSMSTDPQKQQNCLKCHDSGGDSFGTAMSEASKDIKNQFAKASKHDITGTDGAQLTCANCHGPHNVSKNPLSAGLNNSDISNPANTLFPYTTADGDMSRFCIICHRGNPPQAVNDGTTLVPYSVTFPAWVFTSSVPGWDKSAYTGATPAGHYASGYQCNKCHDNHGSLNPRLTLLPEDPASPPASNSGICLQCHGNQTGRPDGAADVYTDLTRVTDFTYRHPTLDYSGLHSDNETFPWTADNRHAECVDCHDPHSANYSNLKTIDSVTNTAPAASNILRNATGVKVTSWPGAWTVIPVESYNLGAVTDEFELCLKCHSSFNGNFPTPPSGAAAETDIAKEFNPNNASYHYLGIEGSSSRTSAGTYVGPFNADSKLYCTSCHGANDTDMVKPGAVHGSNNRYILKAPFTVNTGTGGTQNDLCYKCHDKNTYGAAGTNPNTSSGASGFSNSNQGNLHVSVAGHRVACVSCHSAVPHGWTTPKLLVQTSDPAPYNNGSKLIINNLAGSGSWEYNNCSGCH